MNPFSTEDDDTINTLFGSIAVFILYQWMRHSMTPIWESQRHEMNITIDNGQLWSIQF